MNLPTLLRRLQQAAHGQDRRGVAETLAALRRHHRWAGDVSACVAGMSTVDAEFVSQIVSPPEVLGFAGGINQSGTGGRAGVAPGINVTRDATSGIYLPSTSTEWTTFNTAFGLTTAVPNSCWTMQMASGNASDTIGSLTMTAAGAPTYNSVVSGWARTGVLFADAGSDRLVAAAATGPDPSTTSTFWLGLFSFPATPATARAFFGPAVNSASTGVRANHQTNGKLALRCVGVSSADSATSHSAGVHMVGVKYDRTGAVVVMYSDLDKTPGTYSASAVDQNKGFGAAATAAGAEVNMWGVMWSGSNSEISDANVKLMLQAMGYTIGWS